ncbi:hypothetical protein ABTD90_21935, partial [Acinetobacter baumannii]
MPAIAGRCQTEDQTQGGSGLTQTAFRNAQTVFIDVNVKQQQSFHITTRIPQTPNEETPMIHLPGLNFDH